MFPTGGNPFQIWFEYIDPLPFCTNFVLTATEWDYHTVGGLSVQHSSTCINLSYWGGTFLLLKFVLSAADIITSVSVTWTESISNQARLSIAFRCFILHFHYWSVCRQNDCQLSVRISVYGCSFFVFVHFAFSPQSVTNNYLSTEVWIGNSITVV